MSSRELCDQSCRFECPKLPHVNVNLNSCLHQGNLTTQIGEARKLLAIKLNELVLNSEHFLCVANQCNYESEESYKISQEHEQYYDKFLKGLHHPFIVSRWFKSKICIELLCMDDPPVDIVIIACNKIIKKYHDGIILED